ncbi:sodium:proton antiporter [Alteromonas pelagimontana]|uniref:Sodium:proton antiporter n=1 Tax=Alteromonas pelagimontana TaxID=1858656 RepID=A0A6M4MBG2_9ALTE|nr:cation:proton antiporter [Alteromonas pelagimontana]QJR80532.1 sodium:proton antiporter [Alteromonas pelagimontana]
MHEFNIGLLVIAASALVLGLLSKPLKRIGLPDAFTLLLLGIVLGPTGIGLLDPAKWGKEMVILEQVARLALAIGLMGIAMRLPRSYIFHHWRSLSVLLLVGMVFMWLCSSALTGWILGLPMGAALLIGAAVTPTDPVVASSVVTGNVAKENLPAYLRRIISSESGANDGLAFIFVMVGVFVLTLPPGESMTMHVLEVIVGDVLVALVIGVVIGYAVGFALRKAEEKKVIEQSSMLMITTALALMTLAAVKLMGSDGILAVFVAGLAFDCQVNASERQEEERVVEGVDRFFTSPIFILLGLMIPVNEWLSLGWPALALIVAILLFRRLPLLLLLGGRMRDLPSKLDGGFAGWFGPIGVAALYYAALAHHKTDVTELWPVVSLLVVSSIVVHGLTAMPFSHLYRRLKKS